MVRQKKNDLHTREARPRKRYRASGQSYSIGEGLGQTKNACLGRFFGESTKYFFNE